MLPRIFLDASDAARCLHDVADGSPGGSQPCDLSQINSRICCQQGHLKQAAQAFAVWSNAVATCTGGIFPGTGKTLPKALRGVHPHAVVCGGLIVLYYYHIIML